MPPVREVVVTSFGEQGSELGRKCVESLVANVSAHVVVYLDEWMMLPDVVTARPTRGIPGWLANKATLPFRRHDAEKPENYIWNAHKFAVKPYVWLDAAERLRQGVLVWLDGDTVVKERIPDGFFEGLLGDAAVAYLGRGEMHPETGFVAFRIPDAMPLLHWCVDFYRLHEWMTVDDGWTDCHVLRRGMVATRTPSRDLTSHLCDHWTSSVDAFALSPLGPYVQHFKGPQRKREALVQ